MPLRTRNRTGWSRQLSVTERAWLAADSVTPPYCNHMIIEADDALDVPRWTAAVEAACEVNPGSRVVLEGRLANARWVDSGVAARVRSVDGSRWDGRSPAGAPWTKDPLPWHEGPTCEVVLAHGAPSRVIFRTLHAVTDWRGADLWIEDIFHALRGEPLVGARGTVTEKELADRVFPRAPFRLADHAQRPLCGAPTGRADGEGLGITWCRRSVAGIFPAVIPQVALQIAKHVAKHNPSRVKFGVPVDLRGRAPDVERAVNNLTGFIDFELPFGGTIESMITDLKTGFRERRELLGFAPDVAKLAPIKWVAELMRRQLRQSIATSRFGTTAIISNLGRIPPIYQYEGFRTQRIYGIPPYAPWSALFVGLGSFGGHLEVCVSTPEVFATRGRLEQMTEEIAAGLVPKAAKKKAAGGAKT